MRRNSAALERSSPTDDQAGDVAAVFRDGNNRSKQSWPVQLYRGRTLGCAALLVCNFRDGQKVFRSWVVGMEAEQDLICGVL